MIKDVPKELVPPDPVNIWGLYGQGAVSQGLQKALSTLIDDRIAADYGTARGRRCDKQRMVSCSARNSGRGSWPSLLRQLLRSRTVTFNMRPGIASDCLHNITYLPTVSVARLFGTIQLISTLVHA